MTERTNLRSEFILISFRDTAADVSLLMCSLHWLRISMKAPRVYGAGGVSSKEHEGREGIKGRGPEGSPLTWFWARLCALTAGSGGVGVRDS